MDSIPMSKEIKLENQIQVIEGTMLSRTVPVYEKFASYIIPMRSAYIDIDDIDFTLFWLT